MATGEKSYRIFFFGTELDSWRKKYWRKILYLKVENFSPIEISINFMKSLHMLDQSISKRKLVIRS